MRLSEDKIKERFAAERERLQKTLENDRKAAEDYAKDFDRMQKFQAEQLAKMMAEAEKRREAMMNMLNEREQAMLARFKQEQEQSQEPAPAAE